MHNRLLFWHRRDLRVNDNIGLNKAIELSKAIIGVYILDPKIISTKESITPISNSKIWFLLKSLLELKEAWHNKGSSLIILKGNPNYLIPKLIDSLKIQNIFWNRNIEPYEVNRDIEIEYILTKKGKKVLKFWDQLLVDPNSIKTLNDQPYKVYGAFFKKWNAILNLENSIKESEGICPNNLIGLNNFESSRLKDSGLYNLSQKSIEDIDIILERTNYNQFHISPCKPGEKEAKAQLNYFCKNQTILNYDKNRDIPSLKGTSCLSASLNLGTISCRETWRAAKQSKLISRNQREEQSINTWIKELAWREFYQNILLNFPQLSNGPYRKKWEKFPWANNEEYFNSWLNGTTGFPIIDAAMRELNTTSWMHNRCRMIVSSFLVKDLFCNWQWGEKAFMNILVDGDLAANNGGWQWSASSGMDTKPLRIFNPSRQAHNFDPKADYIRYWIPELAHVPTADLITGEITPIERKGYPSPLVNHKEQQAIFKKLYAKLTT